MTRVAAMVGIGAQALVLGTGLFLAVMRLLALTGGARVFQYQGF